MARVTTHIALPGTLGGAGPWKCLCGHLLVEGTTSFYDHDATEDQLDRVNCSKCLDQAATLLLAAYSE